jgi:hypothetical protein
MQTQWPQDAQVPQEGRMGSALTKGKRPAQGRLRLAVPRSSTGRQWSDHKRESHLHDFICAGPPRRIRVQRREGRSAYRVPPAIRFTATHIDRCRTEPAASQSTTQASRSLAPNLRARHHSSRTEQTYCAWVKLFIFYHDVCHPGEVRGPHNAPMRIERRA